MTNELDKPDEPDEPNPGILDKLWYWVRLGIWPLIRDTDCPYCIFLRGVLYGGGLAMVVYLLWRMINGY